MNEERCCVCGNASFEFFRRRSDGRSVQRCLICNMGVVTPRPSSLTDLYGDEYYHGEEGSEVGYADYSYTAEHSLAWAAALVELLIPSGQVLDIGCADGHLLGKLPSSYGRAGVEVNPEMAAAAERRGVQIIASDILAPDLASRFSGHFDVVFALSVLEHLDDIKAASEVALKILESEGILIFEVPLISPQHGDDEVWFRSSLEHVFYPSAAAIEYLFDRELGASLIGREVTVCGYGSIYLGVVTKSLARAAQVRAVLSRVLDTPLSDMGDGPERWVRVLFDLVHAAHTSPEHISALRPMWGLANEELWKRIVDLWLVTQVSLNDTKEQLSEVTERLAKTEEAKQWHQEQSRRWENLVRQIPNEQSS